LKNMGMRRSYGLNLVAFNSNISVNRDIPVD